MVCLWALESCDLGPRDPEDPLPEEGPLVSLTDPDSTLYQLEIGFESGIITSYMNAFASDFLFHPDPQDSSAVFDNWNVDVERQVAQQILRRFTSRSVGFTPVDSFPDPGDPLVVHIHEDYSLQADTSVYEGLARLQLRRDPNGDWRIISWQDLRRTAQPTWGILRGQNR